MKCDFTQCREVGLALKPDISKLMTVLVVFILISAQVFGQATGLNITGRVTDDKGMGMPGVTVMLKGTTTAAPTNMEGNYSISVPNGTGTLVFTFVGYLTQEVPINNRSTINVQMRTDAKALDEVVVVGYGVQRQEAVTGSVASISGEKLTEVPSANISQALQGRLPGVEIQQSSSRPGATTQIRIRGTRSLTASNDPLVVLDGIPFAGSIGDINPNDIKSVDILKDASATAIYGSRGANGVILVTTKGGKAGQKAQINYSGFQGVKKVFAPYPMMNGQEFAALRKAAGLFQNSLHESDDVNTDWQDLLYQTGKMASHDLGVSGGTENGRYNFSMGYFEDEGVIPTNQYKRYSMRGAIDQGVGKNIRLGLTTYNNYNVTEGNNVGLYNTLSMSPIANPYNADGSLRRSIMMPLDEQFVITRGVVEDLRDRWVSDTRAFGSYNTIYGEVSIPWVEGLKYRTNLGLNYRQSNGGNFTGRGVTSPNPATEAVASINNSFTTDWTIENILTYDRTFAGKHNVNVVGLYSASETSNRSSSASARDIPSDLFQYHNLGQARGEIRAGSNLTESGLMSYMGRVMYSYDDRYMLSATLRTDGSSRLAPGYKWHTYPAVSAGWNIAKETFMENVSLVNMLKLRAGYGRTSNQAINPYATLGLLSPRPYNFGPSTYETGLFVSELPNQNLGWEFSETWNFGLDFAILKHRLTGTIEYYHTKTNDILLRVGLPATSGVSSYVANIGKTQNKGVELSLNGVILDDLNGWTWEAGVNMYGNRNKLVALATGQDRNEGQWWFVGHPINVIFDYERIGLWQEGDPHRNILEPGGNVGMIKVKYTGDYNADGVPTRQIGPLDRQIMDVNPDFQGGFNTRVAYKGFDLTAVGAFQSGGILISSLYSSSGYLNMMTGRRNNVRVDYWTPENTDAKYPKPGGVMAGDNPKYGSTLGYFDGGYLKMRTITLGYNFTNNGWLKNTGLVNNLRLYVTAQNPFVMFSPYHRESGQDPEPNSFANQGQNVAVATGTPGRLLIQGTNSPATRNYLIGLNVTF